MEEVDAELEPNHEQAGWRLDQVLKMSGVAGTGGQAKVLIQGGWVKVDGQVETRRRHMLTTGNRVELNGRRYRVGSNGKLEVEASV